MTITLCLTYNLTFIWSVGSKTIAIGSVYFHNRRVSWLQTFHDTRIFGRTKWLSPFWNIARIPKAQFRFVNLSVTRRYLLHRGDKLRRELLEEKHFFVLIYKFHITEFCSVNFIHWSIHRNHKFWCMVCKYVQE